MSHTAGSLQVLPSAAVKSALQAHAREFGFDTVRVTQPNAIGPAGDRLLAFLADGRHGTMGWLETHADRRRDPRHLWPEVRSVVMLGMSYAPANDPMDALSDTANGVVSTYAKRSDYHDVMKGKLKDIAGRLERDTGLPVKVFVDTAPLMEKPLAAAAGIGWQGKHTNLVSRQHGSWLFLGAILTAAELDPDEPERDHCGNCSRCPTSVRHTIFRHRTSSMRAAASPTSRSSTKVIFPTSSARRSATASSAATTASPSAHGTSSPRRATKRALRSAPSWTIHP
jgi:epoxyqueuosine reductase